MVERSSIHAVTSVTDDDAHMRCLVIPALSLQSFLEESAAAARDGLFTPGGRPRGLRGAR